MPSRAYSIAYPRSPWAGARATGNNTGSPYRTQPIEPVLQRKGAELTAKNNAQQDYAQKALAYMAAMERNKVASASQPSAPVTGPAAPFSATGINIVDPSPAEVASPTVAEAVAPVPKEDPIEEAYKKYLAGVEASRATNTSDVGNIKNAIAGYYTKAAEGNKQTIGNSQTDVDAMAKALGADFAGSREGQLINAGARDRQEQLDSMQAHNLSSVDKVAQLQGGVYDAYGKEGALVRDRSIAERTALEAQKQLQLQQIQAEIEMAMMQAQAAASSGGGGGGGGRRGGGGSRSSSGATTIGENAEEVSYVNNIGDIEALNALSPSEQAAFRRIYNLGGGDVTSALAQGQKLYDDLERTNKRITPGMASGMTYKAPEQRGRISGQINKPKNQQQLKDLNAAIQALTGISGIFGTPTTRRKVQTTSKSSSKKS